jgi:hypothetical protein
MIDGLKLTMTGEELRKRLDQRVKEHERQAAWYKREAKRDPDPNDENDFGFPEHMCEHEEEFHGWRAKALAYIREHVEGGEVYRLNEADLAFGEILPEKPGIVEQGDYEEEHRIGFSLERIAKDFRSRCDPFGLPELQVPRLTAPDRTARRAPAARSLPKARSKRR